MKHKIEYKHIVRPVKYPRIELKSGDLVIVAPSSTNIDEVINKHYHWVSKKIKFVDHHLKIASKGSLKKTNKETLDKLLNKYIRNAEKLLGVVPNSFKIKPMKSKWASCTPRGLINYNELIAYLPNNLIWYITLHEMTHLIVKGHNKKFWFLMNKHIRNFEEKEKELFSYWFKIHKRINLDISKVL